MDIKSMLLPEKVVTFDFPGCEGLSFDLVFLSKESNQALYKKCQTTKFDVNRNEVTEFNDELFLQLYVKSIVRGWKGFKAKYLRELVLADVPVSEEETEFPYTDEGALDLMKNSVLFDNWVSGVIQDLGNFTQKDSTKKSEELKITSKSPDQA